MADLRQPDERADEICDVPEPDPLAVYQDAQAAAQQPDRGRSASGIVPELAGFRRPIAARGLLRWTVDAIREGRQFWWCAPSEGCQS